MSRKATSRQSESRQDEKVLDKPPPAFQIARQLDQEKINFLALRIEELARSNNELRSGASQNEKDTHDIVLYFQRELEIKDDIILRLNEELVKCQTQLKFEVEKVRKAFETELGELKTSSEHTINGLSMKVETLEKELETLSMFRQEKDLHDERISKLQVELKQQREQLIDAMEEQERRFLEDKSQIFKDLDDQKAAFREVALQEARMAMGEEIKKILADNNRMFEELRFHHTESVNFQAEKTALMSDLSTSKRELNILAEKEIEYAKQSFNRSKEIKILRDRYANPLFYLLLNTLKPLLLLACSVEYLEKAQATNIERFKVRAKELKATVSKELEEATLDATGLRRLIHIKNQELKHMKALAATILSQRTETEQFFLEALNEVKDVIRQERKVNAAAINATAAAATAIATSSKTKTGGGAMFPPLAIKQSQLHLMEARRKQPDVPLEELDRVTIADLSWEDKELVIRVLFSKMNGNNQNSSTAALARQRSAMGEKAVPQPVFISEGAQMVAAGQPGLSLQHFEVMQQQSGDDASQKSLGSAQQSLMSSLDNGSRR